MLPNFKFRKSIVCYVYARPKRFELTECVCFRDNVRKIVPEFWC